MEKFPRCSHLKVKQHCGPFVEWYEDLQSDRQKYVSLFFPWIGIGYGERKDEGDDIDFISPEQTLERRKAELGKLEELVVRFVTVMLKGGSSASSCYSLFYEDYKGKDTAKKSTSKVNFIKALPLLSKKEIEDRVLGDNQLSLINLDEWMELGQSGLSADDIWDKVSQRLVTGERSLGVDVRHTLKIRCQRPRDRGYCVVLMEMVARQLRSCYECYKNHLNELQELREKTTKQITESRDDLFSLVCDLATVLTEQDSGLSERTLFSGRKQALKPQGKPSKIQAIVDELRQPQYSPLLEADDKELRQAYKAWNSQRRLRDRETRRPYPCRPNWRNDYQVSLGLTGRGGFWMWMDGSDVVVDLQDCGRLTCSPSHYFGDLAIEGQLHQYDIRYRNKLKRRGKKLRKPPAYGEWIEATIKEIGIQRKGGDYYVYLLPVISHDSTNFQAAKKFFAAAAPKQEIIDALPDEMKVLALDLNISNPVCSVKARIGRALDGPLSVLDYGQGEIVDGPKILVTDGPRCVALIELHSDVFFVKDAIREYKRTHGVAFNGAGMDDEMLERLSSIPSPSPSVRCQIQAWVAAIGKRLHLLHYGMRREGYKNLGEAIRLLAAMDAYDSMFQSYQRIHLKKGQSLPRQAKNDHSRAGLRETITRRIAYAIAQEARDCNVVFVEDLKADFDADNDNNALLRLFAVKTLIRYIQEALEKIGVGLVLVAKDGTSKTNPMNGDLGWRDRNNKEHLYFELNGEAVRCHADLVASLNVLLRGLDHSVCPYSFVTKDTNKKPGRADQKDKGYGKRLKRFFKDRFGSSNLRFVAKPDGEVTATTRRPKDALIGERVYYHGGKLVTSEVHYRMENEIKHLLTLKSPAKELSLTEDGIRSYENFTHV